MEWKLEGTFDRNTFAMNSTAKIVCLVALLCLLAVSTEAQYWGGYYGAASPYYGGYYGGYGNPYYGGYYGAYGGYGYGGYYGKREAGFQAPVGNTKQ